jgi:hypothetical protein
MGAGGCGGKVKGGGAEGAVEGEGLKDLGVGDIGFWVG